MLTVEFARMNKEVFFRLGLAYASIGPGKNHLQIVCGWLGEKENFNPCVVGHKHRSHPMDE
jgi:hypothetical protein